MPTATESPPAPAAAPAAAFEFNDAGVCTNPEKIHIRCGALGAACALLVAREESSWFAGYQCGGRNVAYTTNAPSRWSAHPRSTREDALRVAREGVLGYLRGINEPSAVAIRAGLEAFFGDANPAPAVPRDDLPPRSAPPEPDDTGEFRFDADGACTNPLRVEIPCPEGYACALLVAQMEDDCWTFGCERTGPGPRESFKMTVERIANGASNRDEALDAALVCALEAGEPGSPINLALEKWRAAYADARRPAAAEAATAAAEKSFEWNPDGKCENPNRHEVPEMPEGQACVLLSAATDNNQWFWGYELTGITNFKLGVDVYSRDGAGCALENAALSNANSAAQEHIRAHGERAHAAALTALVNFARRRAGIPTLALPSDTPTATSESPTGASAAGAPVLPGLAHAVNEHGVFTTWEEIKVQLPKGAAATINLSLAPDGRWAHGLSCSLPTCGLSGLPRLHLATHANRGEALDAAYRDAFAFFRAPGQLSAKERKLADRAAEAIRRIQEDFRPKVTAAAPVEPPTPETPRPAPNYRTEFADLPLAKIQENPANHRKHYEATSLRELADSLLSEGLHQPIAVRRLLDGETPEGQLPLGDPGAPEFELIFGHRRRRAALVAGLPTLQAKIYHGLTRRQATAIALIENLQRVDINPMEEAEGYEQLMLDEQLTQEAVAARVGRPRSTVTHSLGLLKLPGAIREAVRDGLLKAEHAKALARFVPTTESARELWAKEVPHWALIVALMAEQAIEQKVGREYLEKGVPFVSQLCAAGLAVRIDQFGEHRVNPKQREHPAYFAMGDGDWVCLNPDHWAAEVADRRRRAAEKEEAERARRAAELEKLAKNNRKQLRIADLDPAAYREFRGASEPLIALVPDDKKAAAKGDAGRTTIVTDTDLADRLEKAMLRAIRENRRAAIASLDEKVRKKLAKLRRPGPREWAWLVYLVADPKDRSVQLHLDAAVAKQIGTKLPIQATQQQVAGIWCGGVGVIDASRRLAALAKCEIGDLLRVLIAERLPIALEEIANGGPDTTGGHFVKWWLDSDTLWLLEETDEGRAQLVETVKASKWYARILSGEKTTEGEE